MLSGIAALARKQVIHQTDLPPTNSTEILVNGQSDLPIELTVSNMLGQVVYRDGADSRAQTHSFRLNVSDFDPGIYLYTVKIGDKSVTKKMLVN